MSDPALSQTCADTADALGEAIDWVSAEPNGEIVGAERKLILKDLRRGQARARKLSEAALRPMCIGVYGPSQAGKSYLVSVLARPQDGSPMIAALDVPGGGLDFLAEINPEGDKEATGLVTRFTTRREPCPQGFPVQLRMFGEADVIRVLANSFVKDGDGSEADPTSEILANRIAAAERRAGAAAPGLTSDDIWEIQEYFERSFISSSYVKALSGFWEPAAALAPRLARADRAAFMSVLWGGYDGFTEIYTALTSGLDQLGHPAEAFAAIDALTPRATSIIDVATLSGLDGEPGAFGEVRLRSSDGREAALARPVLAALTAELILPLAAKSWPIFEQSDLLDFPGVRERRAAKGPIDAFMRSGEAPKKELFLRGKVGFLFERYVAEQELTSMLLCVPPSNLDVAADLNDDVGRWIASAQGATPEERVHSDTMLFFVLTKFDMHLAEKGGSQDVKQRFDNRMEASLFAPFGNLKESWPRNWTPGAAFQNCYWLRNPQYHAEMAFTYDADGRETPRVEKADRMAELKAGSLASEAVRTHFKAPSAAWDAALTPNDGGVAYLVENLTPISDPAKKANIIRVRHTVLTQAMHARLAPFYVDDDVAKRLEAREAVASEVTAAASEAFYHRRFGAILEGLKVDADEVAARIDRPPEDVRFVSTAAPAAKKPAVALPGAGARIRAETAEQNGATSKIRAMTREQYQAETAALVWMETMSAFAARPDVQAITSVTGVHLSEIAAELAAAARRLGLADTVAGDLARWNFGARSSGQSEAAALVACRRINDLVERLAVETYPPQLRPKVETEDGARIAFAEPPNREHAFDLPNDASAHDRVLFEDWSFALYRLFQENAKGSDPSGRDPEENARLGAVLKRLG